MPMAVQAQTVYKVDINEFSRNNMDEVLEPGFTPWKFPKDSLEATLEVDGATFIIRSEHNLRAGWNKAFVQKKEFNCRLTGDGANLDPNECGSFDLVIKGLAPGQHTIQTYHSSWANPATTVAWPLTLKLNGEVVGHAVERTMQQPAMADATVLVTTFDVASSDEEVVFTISTSDDDAPADMGGKTGTDKTPVLNGFLIDAISTSAQAKRPNPADQDMHVDADEGTYCITWTAANANVTVHRFYFGTDSATVAEATTPTYEGTDTFYVATGLRNLDTYYWRVDETSSDGTVTRGEPWKFRPRHLAFPGAEGYGRYANGGRGGVVYHVTNLLDDGQPGSFRYGMETLKGPRTIVFDVSGIIPLRGTLRAGDGFATIAGQTAPGKGICFRGAAMGFGSDQIVRFIRNRVGSGPTDDGMGFRPGQVGVSGQIRLREGPERIGFRFRTSDEVLQAVILFLVEVIDVHQLLRTGIAPEGGPVRNHLRGEVRADARQGLESSAVGLVDVQAGNVDIGFQPFKDGVCHDVGLGEIRRPAETAALLPVMQDGLRLLLGKAQPHQVFQRYGIGIEAERLHFPGCRLLAHADSFAGMGRGLPDLSPLPEHLLRQRTVHHIDRVRRVPVRHDARNRRLVDEQGDLVTDDQKNEGDGPHRKTTPRSLLSLPLFHNASA